MDDLASSTRARPRRELAGISEWTLRRADLTAQALQQACVEAVDMGLSGMCVASSRVLAAHHFLGESGLKVIAAVGYPLGVADADCKRFETEVAIDHGASVVEVTLNLGMLKDGDDARLLRELRDVVEAAEDRPVGVCFEPHRLAASEVERVMDIAVEAGIRGVTAVLGEARDRVAEVHGLASVLRQGLALKLECLSVQPEEAVRLLDAGVVRFAFEEIQWLTQA